MFTRLYSWVADKNAGIPITASRMDADTDDIVTGLENTVTLDGQTTPVHSLPMGGFTHTNVGNATARTNYAAAGQVQDCALLYGGVSGGSANVQTISLTPAITSYVAGQKFHFIAGFSNTGALTLNVNSVGAKAVQWNGAALTGGEIVSGGLVEVAYDGTQFQMISSDRAGYQLADVASASTINLDDAARIASVDVTGTTTITAVTLAQGKVRFARFTGALTLTNGASLVLPGAANITTVAGDYAIFVGYASSVVRCIYVPVTPAPYSTGSWTPTDASGAALSLTVADATYIKIGKLVFVTADILYPSTASGLAAVIGGLPFTVANTTNSQHGGAPSVMSANFGTIRFIKNTTTAELLTPTGGSTANSQVSTAHIRFGLYYMAA